LVREDSIFILPQEEIETRLNIINEAGMYWFAKWRGHRELASAIPQTSSKMVEARAKEKEKERKAWRELIEISDERELLMVELEEAIEEGLQE
jgi:ACT domain-containing protein